MKSDFEQLLNNCQNRINEEKVQVIKVSNGSIVESLPADDGEVRPGIKNIIQQKMRETEVRTKASKESAKILFSLKDFQEKKEIEESSIEKDNDDLNEDDGSVRDVSFDGEDLPEENSDIEEVEVVKENSDGKATETVSGDLESEIIKLEKTQREVDESFKKDANTRSETVLLKMNDPVSKMKELLKGQARAGISISRDPVKHNVAGHTRKEEVIDIEDSKEKKVEVKAPSQKKTPSKVTQGTFRNISISVVGEGGERANKNINIQNIFKSSSSSGSSSGTASGTVPKGFSGPNISLKRKSSDSRSQPANDSKKFRSSAIVITPASRNIVPTISLDLPDDNQDERPEENLASNYDNCTHGDPMGYLCRDCIYLRWKTAFEFVRTRKEKPKQAEDPLEDPLETTDMEPPPVSPTESSEALGEPADIIKNVNWQQVFSFAGISVGQRTA